MAAIDELRKSQAQARTVPTTSAQAATANASTPKTNTRVDNLINKSNNLTQQSIQAATAGRGTTTTNPRVDNLVNKSNTAMQNSIQAATANQGKVTTNPRVDNLVAKSNTAMQNSIKAATGNTAAITSPATATTAKAAAPTTSATSARVAQMQNELAARQAQQNAARTTSGTGSIVAQTARPTTASSASVPATSAAATPSAQATVPTTAASSTPATENTTAATNTSVPTGTVNATNTPSNTTVNNTFTPATYTPTGMYDPENLRAYNERRETDLRALYDAALQNTLNGMRTAYDQNMSDATAAKDLISPQYQSSKNALSAEYERQRRNNNMQAAANGLNTGAGSQMALAQSANYQANRAGLEAKENEALNEANRRIGDLQRNYQNAIAEATANNNYKLAAAMMEEYQNAYKRQMDIENTNYQRAQQLDQQNYTRSWNEDERTYSRGVDEANRKAQYGDFSGYRDLYGDDTATLMEQTWAMQNPYQAWASGKLSAADFYALTGKLPADPNSVAGQLPGGGDVYTGLNPEAEAAAPSYLDVYGNYSNSLKRTDSLAGLDPTKGAAALRQNTKSYSRSYSSGRSGGSGGGGYTGPAGYYDIYGNFISPEGGFAAGTALNAPGAGTPSEQSIGAAKAAGYDDNKVGSYQGTPDSAGKFSVVGFNSYDNSSGGKQDSGNNGMSDVTLGDAYKETGKNIIDYDK